MEIEEDKTLSSSTQILLNKPFKPLQSKYFPESSSANKKILPLNSWRPSKEIRWMTIKDAEKIRQENNILVEGEDLIAPLESFRV